MQTTLNEIRKHRPCQAGWGKLLCTLGKTKGDDAPLHLRVILDSNGLDDALWCLRAVVGETRVMRLYAVWCAAQVRYLMIDQRSIDALKVAKNHANGIASVEQLAAAARAAAWAATAARAARDAADADAAWAAAWAARAAAAAAWAARDAAWAAQEVELSRVLDCLDAGEDPYPNKA